MIKKTLSLRKMNCEEVVAKVNIILKLIQILLPELKKCFGEEEKKSVFPDKILSRELRKEKKKNMK